MISLSFNCLERNHAVPELWFNQYREKWRSKQWQAELSLPELWSPVCTKSLGSLPNQWRDTPPCGSSAPGRTLLGGDCACALVSESWLQKYVNEPYENTPKEIDPSILPEKNFSPVIECDEMWSFVEDKRNKQWLWLTIDRDTRLIVAGSYCRSRDLRSTGVAGKPAISL